MNLANHDKIILNRKWQVLAMAKRAPKSEDHSRRKGRVQ